MQEDNPAPETASTSGLSKAGGKVRRVSRLSSSPVLPKLCIICTKEHKTDKKSTARYERLTTCEFFKQGISYSKLLDSVNMNQLFKYTKSRLHCHRIAISQIMLS